MLIELSSLSGISLNLVILGYKDSIQDQNLIIYGSINTSPPIALFKADVYKCHYK